MSAPVSSLFVTLRRSLAGTRDQHVRILRSLGLWRREQTVEKVNNAGVRGAIDKARRGELGARSSRHAGGGRQVAAERKAPSAGKAHLQAYPLPALSLPLHHCSQVKHMVSVETDVARAARLAAEAAAKATRPPVVVKHGRV